MEHSQAGLRVDNYARPQRLRLTRAFGGDETQISTAEVPLPAGSGSKGPPPGRRRRRGCPEHSPGA
ncbi:hypothetical protein [Streptomyces chartreusis]|uniref:hypothetical protein n=1 Tax=Streptomyces chartreusis TaxID=1969 RepID=UPI0036884653